MYIMRTTFRIENVVRYILAHNMNRPTQYINLHVTLRKYKSTGKIHRNIVKLIIITASEVEDPNRNRIKTHKTDT